MHLGHRVSQALQSQARGAQRLEEQREARVGLRRHQRPPPQPHHLPQRRTPRLVSGLVSRLQPPSRSVA